MDCCSGFMKCLIIFFNVIFLLLGLVLLAFGIVLNVSFSIITGLVSSLDGFLDLSAFETASVVFIIVGLFVIAMSIIGMCAACCGKKPLYIIYLVGITLIFLAHMISIIILGVNVKNFGDELDVKMDGFVTQLNARNSLDLPELEQKCATLKNISRELKCCGADGYQDFMNRNMVSKCCDGAYELGCKGVISSTVVNAINIFFILPNSIIIAFEFLCVILSLVLVIKAFKESKSFVHPGDAFMMRKLRY